MISIVDHLVKSAKKVIKKLKRYRSKLIETVYVRYLDKLVIEKRTVLVESYHGASISGSPFYMMLEYLKRGNYKVYCVSSYKAFKKNKQFIKDNSLQVSVVILSSLKYYRLLASAEILINNTSFPPSFIKKPGQTYINTWHGTPWKNLGKRMPKGIESMFNIQRNFLQADILVHPNEYTKEHMMEDYNLNQTYTGKVIVSGYPRNTVFSDKERAVKTKELLNLSEKKVYIYMPTWRGVNSYSAANSDDAIDVNDILSGIDAVLDEYHYLYVNLHSMVQDAIDYNKFKYIFPFPTTVPQYDFINAADALITDYSSIFFDYSITKKPVILFMYDYTEYMEDRGVYFDVSELPFRKVYKLQELLDIISSREIDRCFYEDEEYYNKFLIDESPTVTEDLVNYVESGNTHGLKIYDYSDNAKKKWVIRIQPDLIDDKEKMDRFLHLQNTNNTLFLIDKKYFTLSVNQWFYEEYNDFVTYLIYSPKKLYTLQELIEYKLHGNSSLFYDRYMKRELDRIAPNINASSIV